MNMDYRIDITAMNKIPHPAPNKTGDVVIANFDATVGPFVLTHCALARLYKGERYKGLTVWWPHIRTPHGLRGIRCDDKELSIAVRDAAKAVFAALGGEVEIDEC